MSALAPTIPRRTAVLIIDVQTGLFRTSPAPFDAAGTIARINETTAKARAAGVPVIFIQHDGDPAEACCAPFTEGWKFHPDLCVQPGDLTLRKQTCDAFQGTPLEPELRARGIATVVLMGYATEFCLDSTLRVAVSKDFRVIVIADAHTTSDCPVLGAEHIREHHNWAWANLLPAGAVTVIKAADVVFPDRG